MVLRRIKNNLKKIMQRKRSIGKVKDTSVAQTKLKGISAKPVSTKEVIGTQETVIEKTKFSTTIEVKVPRAMPQELPEGYGQDRIVVQVRDPWWIHAYWEVASKTLEKLRTQLGDLFFRARKTLRLYDISHIIFDGTNAHRFFDINVGEATNWYIDTAGPGRSWCVDFGLLLPDGRFITIARSNTVHTPLDTPSRITDEEWMVPEEMFARLYGMGFGLGRSSPVGRAWQERIRKALFSGILSSPGLASAASPVKKIPKERKFWLVVNTELIVYGATEPNARVYVQDREIKLRPDGTFTLRYALPDGKQVIPVRGIAADGLEERTITPVVTKETR